jgi:pimeloyl-ACP methyl ester carboxylesterase
MSRKLLGALVVVIAVLVSSLSGFAPADADGRRDAPRPVIFVHGGSGSGAQFDTQALRLTSSGYPADRIAVHEYDSTFGTNTMDQVWAGLDELIAELLDETGADGVDLLGHSLGTTVSQGYLNSSPERAARVAHYVNIDGRTATSPPGGVATLAVWGEGDQTRQIVGAQNYYAPDQSHVQVATSAETFAQIYEFFTGRAPETTEVVRQPGRIRLSGEANVFPQNQGADGCVSSRSTAIRASVSTGTPTPRSRSARTVPGARSGRTPASTTSSP